MAVYLIMLFICCVCGFFCDANKDMKIKKILIIVAFFSLFAVSGFRYGVGQDFFGTYIATFEKMRSGIENVRIDYGFYLMSKLIIFLKGSSQWIFIITSLIINAFVCKSIYDQSKNKFLSLFIYICGTFFFFSLNGIRQAITISLFYFSLKYIKEKKVFKYMALNGVGLLFHQSAIIFIPLYFFLNKRIALKYKIILISLIILFNTFLSTYLMSFLENTKYHIYINNGAFKPLKSLNASSIINVLLFALYEIKYKKEEGYSTIYSNVHYIGVLITLFFTSIPLAIRVFVSFRYIEFLSVPLLVADTNSRIKKILGALVVCAYLVYFLYSVYIMNGNTVLPYKSIFC